MIAHLSGTLGASWNQDCIVETPGGVGYLVHLPAHAFAQLPLAGQPVAFYICMVVREDAMDLFGFDTLEERQTFEILRSISKVGPRTALAVLSVYRPAQLYDIVQTKNQSALAKVSGIGGKTAQHILLELAYKLSGIKYSAPTPSVPISSAQQDTLGALANLGYAEEECAKIVAEIFNDEPDLDVGSAIRLALKRLAKGKS